MKDLLKKEQLLTKLKNKELILLALPLSMQEDIEVVKIALKIDGQLSYIPAKMRNHLEVACLSMNTIHWVENLKLISEQTQKEPEFLLASLPYTIIDAWNHLSKILKEDKEFFKKALQINPKVYQFASSSIQNDRDMVMAMVKKSGQAFSYVNEKFQKDKEIALVAFKTYPALKFVHISLQNNKEVVLSAVGFKGSSLAFASSELQDDDEVVLRAIRSDAQALRFASMRLRNQRELVEFAVSKKWQALNFAHDDIKNDLLFMFKWVKKDIRIFQFCGKEIKKHIHNKNEPLIEMEKLVLQLSLDNAEKTELKEELKRNKIKI